MTPDAFEHLVNRFRIAEHDPGENHLSRDWIGPPDDCGVTDVINLVQDALNLCGIHLLTAYVDKLRPPSEDAHPLSVDLDRIPGIKPSLGVERGRPVEVSEHG